MFVFNGTDYSLVIVPLLIGLGLFGLQLILCYKTKNKALRLIPVYIVGLVFLMALLTAFSKSSGSYWDLSSLFAMILAVIGICLGFFVGAAWLIYYLAGKGRK